MRMMALSHYTIINLDMLESVHFDGASAAAQLTLTMASGSQERFFGDEAHRVHDLLQIELRRAREAGR